MKVKGIFLFYFIVVSGILNLHCETITILNDQLFGYNSDAKSLSGKYISFSFMIEEDGEYLPSIFLRAEAAKDYSFLLTIENETQEQMRTAAFDFQGRGFG